MRLMNLISAKKPHEPHEPYDSHKQKSHMRPMRLMNLISAKSHMSPMSPMRLMNLTSTKSYMSHASWEKPHENYESHEPSSMILQFYLILNANPYEEWYKCHKMIHLQWLNKTQETGFVDLDMLQDVPAFKEGRMVGKSEWDQKIIYIIDSHKWKIWGGGEMG